MLATDVKKYELCIKLLVCACGIDVNESLWSDFVLDEKKTFG